MTHYYIGHATDENIRLKASSGGIGTAITKYLLSLPDFGTSITFSFDLTKCMYVPKLIHSGEEINVCGSIHQDIDIVGFVKNNIANVMGGVVITCPPCQVSAIRQLLKRNNIKSFILSYCCSGQTTVEGTWCYLKFLGIDKTAVQFMQYRGNGWPSGIQIQTKDSKIFHPNYTEPWVTIHRSGLFRPKRCFYCKRDTGRNADIALADPWLDEYKKNDTIGNTLFLVNTELGESIFKEMADKKLISYIPTNYDEYAIAQRPNIYKELHIKGQEKFLKRQLALKDNKHYFKWATRSVGNMRRHLLILRLVKLLSSKRNMSNFIYKRFNKTILLIRSKIIARKLSGSLKHFNISGGVTINNPKCVLIGDCVGIGENTFFGPVTEYAGIPYNPKIIIGDWTWIGKNCSIAAIDRVEIGKHVLFAGHVHITDHSHGYEDISKPVSQQPLISKGPVIIEDDCWLGFSCEILSGVHIGRHCIVAARAVVTKDVPPYSIVAGNPARVVKQYNFETKQWEKTKIKK